MNAIIFISILSILILSCTIAGIISYLEHEIKAGNIFICFSLVLITIIIVDQSLIPHYSQILRLVLYIGLTTTLLTLLLPIKGTKHIKTDLPTTQIDERITMFSRAELSPGDTNYKKFYEDYPEKKDIDNKWRKNPGLLNSKSKYYKQFAFAAAKASFNVIGNNKLFRTIDPKEKQKIISDKSFQKFIFTWGKTLGASDIGFCKLEKYHWYSIKGRGKEYGNSVIQKHTYAIAITVPMDYDLVRTAPTAPTIIESSHQYVDSGIIALQIANFLGELGYEATAHIDGAYELVVPLVAADAGLGTIGRMGLLISKNTGPRCRIAVVSTNYEFSNIINSQPDKSIIDFCRICKKCAYNCPSAAISKKDREIINGCKRWKINQEACYSYWTKMGTDCAKCMIACPYSHPDNILHKIIRHQIKRNVIFRHLAVKMDNIFYGGKTKSRQLPNLNK
jgi:reductive dehalogenase